MSDRLALISVGLWLLGAAAIGVGYARIHTARSHDGMRRALFGCFLGLGLIGAAMLVLPGQGILTILAGVMLLDFPGRHRLVCWIVTRHAVLNSLNWVRRRAGRPELIVDTPT